MTGKNRPLYTQYTSFMNLNTGEYFFKTYENQTITRASLCTKETKNYISLGKINRNIKIINI